MLLGLKYINKHINSFMCRFFVNLLQFSTSYFHLKTVLLRLFKLISVCRNQSNFQVCLLTWKLEEEAMMKWAPVFYQERTFYKFIWTILTITYLGITSLPGIQTRRCSFWSKYKYKSHYLTRNLKVKYCSVRRC